MSDDDLKRMTADRDQYLQSTRHLAQANQALREEIALLKAPWTKETIEKLQLQALIKAMRVTTDEHERMCAVVEAAEQFVDEYRVNVAEEARGISWQRSGIGDAVDAYRAVTPREVLAEPPSTSPTR